MTVSPHLCRIRTVIGVSINGFKEMEILSKGVINIIKHESWKHVTDWDGRPYGSFAELVERPAPDGMHTTLKGLRAYLENYPKAQAAIDSTLKVGKNGRPKKGSCENSDFIRVLESKGPTLGKVGGTSREYLAARLNNGHPAIAARVRAGEISARAGAIEAGIIKVKTHFEKVLDLLPKLTAKEKSALRRKLGVK